MPSACTVERWFCSGTVSFSSTLSAPLINSRSFCSSCVAERRAWRRSCGHRSSFREKVAPAAAAAAASSDAGDSLESGSHGRDGVFSLSSWQLALVFAGIMFGATALGLVAGRSLSHHAEGLREPFGVVQAALLTLVGLVLAFGLAMAVGRYDARRSAVVNDANAIGTAYLRAQTLREPVRSRSLPLYVQYADASHPPLTLGARQPGREARDRCRVGACSAASGRWRARRSTPSRPSRRRVCTWRA